MSPVPAVGRWTNNAKLIADVATLGYIGPSTLDLSYGRGKFWTEHQPANLVTNDLHPGKGDHHHDVTEVPPDHWWDQFDTVVWDGPYRMSGTRAVNEFNDRYGLDGGCQSAANTLDLLRAGVTFAAHCVAPGGTVLVKCQDQVSSGRKYWQTIILTDHAAEHGLTLVDRFDIITSTGQRQPANRVAKHSRSNASTLLVYRAEK